MNKSHCRISQMNTMIKQNFKLHIKCETYAYFFQLRADKLNTVINS